MFNMGSLLLFKNNFNFVSLLRSRFLDAVSRSRVGTPWKPYNILWNTLDRKGTPKDRHESVISLPTNSKIRLEPLPPKRQFPTPIRHTFLPLPTSKGLSKITGEVARSQPRGRGHSAGCRGHSRRGGKGTNRRKSNGKPKSPLPFPSEVVLEFGVTCYARPALP